MNVVSTMQHDGYGLLRLPHESRWQRVQKIRKSADTEPDGRGFGFEFVPAGADAGITLNPTDIC